MLSMLILVVMSVPKDSVFEVGENAPFYRVDADGNVFMQVLNAGDRKNDKAKNGEPIYFRYSRYNLATWYADGTWSIYSGNETAMDAMSCTFNYGDYTLPSSSLTVGLWTAVPPAVPRGRV